MYESRTKDELPRGFKTKDLQGRYIVGIDVRAFTFGKRLGRGNSMEYSSDTLQDHPFIFIKTEGFDKTSRHELQRIIQEERRLKNNIEASVVIE